MSIRSKYIIHWFTQDHIANINVYYKLTQRAYSVKTTLWRPYNVSCLMLPDWCKSRHIEGVFNSHNVILKVIVWRRPLSLNVTSNTKFIMYVIILISVISIYGEAVMEVL